MRAHRARMSAFAFLALLVPACSAPTHTVAPRADRSAVALELTRVIEHELAAKGLPALSIALVEDGEIVWAQGFGTADPRTGRPATAETVYRVGSVSKLFTDIALMQLVEEGRVDLDAPVRDGVPDFAPENPYPTPITLRHLTSHRAGLVREPPVGNYFADDEPTLAATVASLNETSLVHEPGTRTKYSNAGIAVVGRVLELAHGAGYAELMAREVLEPMGLRTAAMLPTAQVLAQLAQARMWSYDGSESDAPTFQLGMAPAGSLYASVLDLARFLQVVFDGGEGPRGAVLRAETLEQMMTPATGPDGRPTRFGIGFAIDELDGHKRCGHGGAIYGFSTELTFLPHEGLGVVVATSMDFSNAVTSRIGEHALRTLLAAAAGEPVPRLPLSEPFGADRAKPLTGRYRAGAHTAELVARGERLLLEWRGLRMEVRRIGDRLVVDDRIEFGIELGPDPWSKLRIAGEVFERLPDTRPEPCPERWREYLGEYGWDHNVLQIRENHGKLEALVEWFFFDRLVELGPDRFALPLAGGLYPGEKIVFRRDSTGAVSHAVLGGVAFARRTPGAPDGETFHIDPLLPPAELRSIALEASAPPPAPDSLAPDLVELIDHVPGLALDLRYATTNNFLDTVFYPEARALMQRPAALALREAQAELRDKGYGLLIHDAYRPWHVTRMFWDATPEELRHFVADPAEGSRHNRGCAVDLTLIDLESGEPVLMTGGYDEFSARSYPEYPGGTSLQRWHRELLRGVLESHGFDVYQWEWWHFDYRDWRRYPILDLAFDEALTEAVK